MLAIFFSLLERIGLSALSAWLQRNRTQEAIDARNKVDSLSDADLDKRVWDDITRK